MTVSQVGVAPAVDVGGLQLIGPVLLAPGRWAVHLEDPTLETRETKTFSSQGRAQGFIDELVKGTRGEDPLKPELPPSMNAQAHEVASTAATPPQLNRTRAKKDPLTGERTRFNIEAVRDTLERYGLDPFAEIAKVCLEQKPLLDKQGNAVLGPDNKPLMVDSVSGLQRAQIMVELGQYVAPKLKAVEHKVEDPNKLTEEQVDERIADRLAEWTQRKEEGK